MAAKKNKNYTVYEIRDLWPQAFVDIGGMGKYNPVYVLFKAIEKTLVNNSSLVVSVLSRVEDYFKLEGLSPKNTIWVPNGISKTQLIDRAPCAAKTNRSGVLTIMYAGAHGPAQNLRVVLEAASILFETQPNIKFQFVGDGSVKQELVEFARENKISNVEFLEPVPKTHIREMLLSSDLLLLPLADAPVFAYGISPNKLFDYLQSRRPVLYFGPASASPLVDLDTGIVVKDLSSTGLANAISRFATLSVEEKKQIGQNGYNLLLEKYILEDNFVKIIKCINESNN
jgi:glycosyltransferase involved in cell wall biosynthesis